jgi:hypothetical protein
MKRTVQFAIGACVIVLAVLVSVVPAQQKGKGPGNFGRFGGSAFFNNLVTIAANEAVQKDAGIGGDVAEKLTSLRDDLNAARQKEDQIAGINRQDYQNMTAEQRQKMNQIAAKLNEEFEPKVKTIVSADQLKRLQQIRFQAAWQNQGPPALLIPEAASELNLTGEQRQKLNALTMEYTQKQRELFTGGFDQAAAAKMREERVSRTLDVLTAEQKEKLNVLKGSQFDVSQLAGGPGGRRGKGN